MLVAKTLYETFLEERRFLKNCSPMTLRSYRQAWNFFEAHLSPIKTPEGIRAALKGGVLEKMNAGKVKPSSINVYLRAFNAFLRWASNEEHFKPPVKSVLTCPRSFYQAKLRNSVQNNTSVCPFAAI